MTSSSVHELARHHLEPRRPHLARARAIARGAATGEEAWRRLGRAGLVPPGERLFRVRARGLPATPPADLVTINTSRYGRRPGSLALPYPARTGEAVLFASVEGMAEAEAAAKEYLRRLEPFRFLLQRDPSPGARVPVWRILGSPVAETMAGPDVCDVEGAHLLSALASHLAREPLPDSAPVRFFAAELHAVARTLWQMAKRPIPAQIRLEGRLIVTPREMIQRALDRYANPFEPLVRIWRLGLGIRRINRETIVLYVPHLPPAQTTSDSIRIRSLAESSLRSEAWRSNTAGVLGLLEAGVAADAEDERGRTALHFAVLGGHRTQAALLSALVEAGADPLQTDDDGHTPLSLAVHRGEVRLVETLIDTVGLDPHHRLAGGRTLLQVAALGGARRTAEALLDRGHDPNERCATGRTALHYACSSHRATQIDVVRTLLDRGADPNARDFFGWTPLHAAALLRYTFGRMIVELLVERGAKSVPDRGGHTPSDVAHDFGAPEATQIREALDAAVFGVTNPLPEVPPWPENDILEGAIADRPDDPEVWSVYADWLASRDELRAELIQLSLAEDRALGPAADRLRRERRAVERNATFALLGELQRFDPRLAAVIPPEAYHLRRGVLESARLLPGLPVRGLLGARSSRLLGRLDMVGTRPSLEALADAAPPALRSLRLLPCVSAPYEMPALPRLTSLRIDRYSPLSLQLSWPGITNATLVSEPDAMLGTSLDLRLELPDLVSLDLRLRHARERNAVGALARSPPAGLESVTFRGPPALLEALFEGELASRLATFSLRHAHPESIALLCRRLPELSRLRRIMIATSALSVAERRDLATRLRDQVPSVLVV